MLHKPTEAKSAAIMFFLNLQINQHCSDAVNWNKWHSAMGNHNYNAYV